MHAYIHTHARAHTHTRTHQTLGVKWDINVVSDGAEERLRFQNLPTRIHPEDSNCSVCRHDGKPSTFHAAYSLKPGLYAKYLVYMQFPQ
jgi:hypothetical protein